MKSGSLESEELTATSSEFICVSKEYLKSLLYKAKDLSTSLAAVRLDLKEMKEDYCSEFKRRMKQSFDILEKSKDFHLQHLVNICESTKAIIQIVTNYSQGK